MYDFDSNGDLYIVTQGLSATGGKSKISRIKAGETDIDADWSLNMDDITEGGKFVSVFAKDGQLITLIPNAPLTGGPTGNINSKMYGNTTSLIQRITSRQKLAVFLPSPTRALHTVRLKWMVRYYFV